MSNAIDRSWIGEAIRSEIAASSKGRKTSWLDIDAIEHLADQPGHFVYRLVLSTPVQMAPDQSILFPDPASQGHDLGGRAQGR